MSNNKMRSSKKNAPKNLNLAEILNLQLIKNDFETIEKIINENRPTDGAPIIFLIILPYLSLSCVEALNILKEKRILTNIKNNSSHSPETIRNDLKKTMNRINKIYKGILEIDEEVDLKFRNEVKYEFIKTNNLYYNIGFYTDSNHRYISNTQYMESIIRETDDKDVKISKSMRQLGIFLGECTKSITTLLKPVRLTEFTVPIKTDVEIFYKDMHTDNLGLIDGLDKSQILFLIHTLATLNGVKNLLSTILPQENTYLFRIKYIVTYYAYCGLEKFKNNIINKNIDCSSEMKDLINLIDEIKADQGCYFNGDFRSCMMHYGLKNKGVFIIDQKLLNQELPFYGLIESCFNGKHFDEQNVVITNLMNKLSSALEKTISLNLDDSKILE